MKTDTNEIQIIREYFEYLCFNKLENLNNLIISIINNETEIVIKNFPTSKAQAWMDSLLNSTIKKGLTPMLQKVLKNATRLILLGKDTITTKIL
jgi:hypothetical protein